MRYTFEANHSSGRRKSWERVVTATDRTQTGVRGLIGSYLAEGRQVDLPEGTVLVEVDHQGAATNVSSRPWCIARVCVVRDGSFVASGWYHWTKRYFDLLDRVDDALAGRWPAAAPAAETTTDTDTDAESEVSR